MLIWKVVVSILSTMTAGMLLAMIVYDSVSDVNRTDRIVGFTYTETLICVTFV